KSSLTLFLGALYNPRFSGTDQRRAGRCAAVQIRDRSSSRMTEFFRLLRYLRPYRIIFAFSIVLMIATGLLEGGTILLLQPIFDSLSGTKTGQSLLAFLPFALPESG